MGIAVFIEKYLWVVITLCYSYQIFYMIYVLFSKDEEEEDIQDEVFHKFGIVTSARDEANVLPQLIDSIYKQDYPKDKIDIFVIADNCTDNTAELCRGLGATVYEREDTDKVGKGYALDFFFKKMCDEPNDYDAFIVLDADNLIDVNYVKYMNRTYNKGYKVITSYRNSKNYDSNWISAGYSLWFLRESKYLNNARMKLGTSCAISGTGFLVSKDLIIDRGGWPYFLLTEDIEFTTDYVIKGEKIGYSGNSMLYDEQPVTFKQSWDQRMRWSKGFYQVIHHYGFSLSRKIFRSFSCFDILMTIFPALFITILSLIINLGKFIYSACNHNFTLVYFRPLFIYLGACYAFLFIVGLITVITEWDKIKCSNWGKIKYTFTFPLFMATYLPIAIVALFKKVEWIPTEHSVVKHVDQY